MKCFTKVAWASTLSLALVACSDGTEPEVVTDQLNFDVAMVAADGLLDDLSTINALFPFGSAANRAPALTRSRTVEFFDGAGNPQEAFDELTTASIQISAEMSGEFSRENWSASISRSREMTITGLEGEETSRTANGSGSEEVTRSRHLGDGGARSYEMSGTSTIQDLVHGVPKEDNPWPLSGMITRQMTVQIVNGPDGNRTVERTAIVTFNGTQFVTMTVNGESFAVDLSARGGNRPFQRRRRR
ncbi:MAG: hypothetical protein BMS9Abin29_1908 [Gemmatimonadota bacterium]|nr:MAG: hypothetical protein BMS9Abin29_1908 [Gemmatimonadota bacterium]